MTNFQRFRLVRWAAWSVLMIICIAVLWSAKRASGATVGELREALKPFPDSAPAFVETPTGVKPAAVEARDGAAVIVPGPAVPPVPPPTPAHRKPYGIAALQPGKQSDSDPSFPRGGRRISLAQLQDADISGYTIRFAPVQIKTVSDAVKQTAIYNGIQECVDNAHTANKWYTILPMSGGPITAATLARHDEIDDQVASRWGGDMLFAAYHVTGVTQASEELHWPGGMSAENEVRMIARMNHARKAMGPDVTLIVALGGGDNAAMKRFATEAAGIGGPWIFKNNNLMAYRSGNNTIATWPDASHNKLLVEICKDPLIDIGEEMVGRTDETLPNGQPRTGTRNINDSLKQMAVLAKRAGEKPSEVYCAVYPSDLAVVQASVLSP